MWTENYPVGALLIVGTIIFVIGWLMVMSYNIIIPKKGVKVDAFIGFNRHCQSISSYSVVSTTALKPSLT
jgi:hypothetical protein